MWSCLAKDGAEMGRMNIGEKHDVLHSMRNGFYESPNAIYRNEQNLFGVLRLSS